MIHKKQALEKGIKVIDSRQAHNPLFENLKANFPQTIKDNQVDLKAIATLLGLDTKANIQGYELTFTGKALANALYSTPSQKTLKLEETFTYHNLESYKHSKESKNAENKKDSNAEAVEMRNCGFQGMSEGVTLESNDRVNDAESAISHSNGTQDNAQNFIIKGDNLDVLKILKSAYSEKIKMIYIDPPYNTKNDNFIYPDNFRKDYKAILQEVGLLEIDDEGNEVESETLQFFRNIQSTRTHSGWLSFMLPRLKLARDLLREDGVIFISIDDNEQANLKILCDEIFGEENFVACIVWRRKTGASDAKGIANITEYSLCYIKNNNFVANSFNENIESYNEKRYRLSDDYVARRGKYYIDNLDRGGIHYSDSLNYGIQCPDGTITYPNGRKEFVNEGWVWTWGEEKFKWGLENGFIEFRKSKIKESGWAVCYKNYLLVDNEDKLIQRSAPYKNLILDILNTHATLELNNLIGSKMFDTPKPVNLIKHFLRLSTSVESNDIILDFFAGSGTTAQAVMELNAEDKGNRKFILVQINEEIIESKSKAAYDFCKNELGSKKPVISDITIERVKRAGEKIANANPDFTICFSVLSLSDKRELITDKQGTLGLLSNAELSPFDKALNLSLQSGKTLDKPLKPIFENKLYACEDCLYLVACDKEVLEFLRKTQNEYIFIDGFEDLSLEYFLNLDSSLSDRLRVVY